LFRIHDLINHCLTGVQTLSDSISTTAQSATAQIIPFPQRRPTQSHDAGNERLQRALWALNAAVEDQRIAVASWRAALSDLTKAVSGLGNSVQRYRCSLDGIAARVGTLRTQALQLERIADAALAASNE
jgi:hypothetical protein